MVSLMSILAFAGFMLVSDENRDPAHEHDTATTHTFEIVDSGKEIGQRTVVVKTFPGLVAIRDSIDVNVEAPGIDFEGGQFSEAVYSTKMAAPSLSDLEVRCIEDGEPFITGSVRFKNGKANMEWSTSRENGRRLDSPTQHSLTVDIPDAPVVLPSTIQTIGHMLLPNEGKCEITWAEIDKKATQRLIRIQTGCTLQRTDLATGGFELVVKKPGVDVALMTLQYNKNNFCDRIMMEARTVMTLSTTVNENVPADQVPHEHPESIRKADESKPLSWKDVFGSDAPENYPTDALSLIGALNNSRGEWVFSGKTNRDDSESEFEASMEIRGGVREFLRQDSFPQWIITIDWPRESPTDRFLFNIMALPEPTGIKWMVAPYYIANGGKPVSGKCPMYEGTWNAETATIVWTSKQMRSPLQKDSPAKGPASPQSTFQMVLKPNGEIRINDYQHNDSFRFSGQSAARVGEPFVEKGPAIQKLPGGYKIFFASRLEVYLEAPGQFEGAGPRIDKIGCEDKYIFGLVATYQHNPESSDKTGYFWVNSETGEITKGLELAAWREALKSKGVNEPRLYGPEVVGE